MQKCKKNCITAIDLGNKAYVVGIKGFLHESRAELKESILLKDKLNTKSKKIKSKIFETLSKIEDHVDTGHYYVQVVECQRDIAHSLDFIISPMFEHFDNQHKPFTEAQDEELQTLIGYVDEFYNLCLQVIKENKFDEIDTLVNKRDAILEYLQQTEKAQIKRIKTKEANTRNSVLYFNINSETKNLLLQSIHLLKAHRNFVSYSANSK